MQRCCAVHGPSRDHVLGCRGAMIGLAKYHGLCSDGDLRAVQLSKSGLTASSDGHCDSRPLMLLVCCTFAGGQEEAVGRSQGAGEAEAKSWRLRGLFAFEAARTASVRRRLLHPRCRSRLMPINSWFYGCMLLERVVPGNQ